MMKKNNVRYIAAGLVNGLIVLIMASLCYGYGNNQTLSILNIKPAGTGTPALSANARIFRAYPGIEYNIRAGVVGGQYPYTFSLSNAPAGMPVSNKGVVSWANPASSASNITLRATDQDGDYVDATWSITVGTSGFIFVDSSHTGTEAGSISQPYNSIQDILDLSSHESDIVYFRDGTYTVPLFHPYSSSAAEQGCNLGYDGGRPRQWISYPDETVTINMDGYCFESGYDNSTEYYFDGLTFTNSINHTLRIDSGRSYVTIRRCDFNGMSQDQESYNANQGFFYTPRNEVSHNLVIQDCKFHDYTDTAGIGSLYYQHDLLIEDNVFYDQHRLEAMICVAIAPKSYIQNCTIRHNQITVNTGAALGHKVNSSFHGPSDDMSSENIEICYNLFNTSGSAISGEFNTHSMTGTMWFYRNTTIGDFEYKYLDA